MTDATALNATFATNILDQMKVLFEQSMAPLVQQIHTLEQKINSQNQLIFDLQEQSVARDALIKKLTTSGNTRKVGSEIKVRVKAPKTTKPLNEKTYIKTRDIPKTLTGKMKLLAEKIRKDLEKKKKVIISDGKPVIGGKPKNPPIIDRPVGPVVVEKLKNAKTFRVDYNDPSQVNEALIEGLKASITTAKSLPTSTGRIDFHVQIGDTNDSSYESKATSCEMQFDFTPVPELNKRNTLSQMTRYSSVNGESYFTLTNENPNDATYVMVENYNYGFLLDTRDVNGRKMFQLFDVEREKGYHQTFRKFLTCVVESARDGNDTEFARFVERLTDPSTRWSLGVFLKILNYFGVYYQEVKNENYDGNDYVIPFDYFLPQNVDASDPEEILGSFGNEARVIVKSDMEYVGAGGNIETNRLRYLDLPRYELSLLDVAQEMDQCGAAAVNYKYPKLLEFKSYSPQEFVLLLPYIYFKTLDHVSLFLNESNRYYFELTGEDEPFPEVDINYVYTIENTWFVHTVPVDPNQTNIVYAYVTDTANNIVGKIVFRSDGHDYLQEQPSNTVRLIKPGSSDFTNAISLLQQKKPCKFGWNENIRAPVVWSITTESKNLNLWYQNNHISIIVDVVPKTCKKCPKCQSSVRNIGTMHSKIAGIKVCQNCHDSLKTQNDSQPEYIAVLDTEDFSNVSKNGAFEASSISFVRCVAKDYMIPKKELLPLNRQSYENKYNQYIKKLKAYEQKIETEIAKAIPGDNKTYEEISKRYKKPQFEIYTEEQLNELDKTFQIKTAEITARARKRADMPFTKAFNEELKDAKDVDVAVEIMCNKFGFEITEFEGETCLEQFADFLIELNKRKEHCFIFAHNAARFDNIIMLEKFLGEKYIQHFQKTRFINQGSQVIKFVFAGHMFFDSLRYLNMPLSKICDSFKLPRVLRKMETLESFIDPVTGLNQPIKVKDFFNMSPEGGFHCYADWDNWCTKCGVAEEFRKYGKLDVVSLLICILQLNDSLSNILINQVLSIEIKNTCFEDVMRLEESETAILLNELRYGSITKPTLGSWVMNLAAQKEKLTKKLLKRVETEVFSNTKIPINERDGIMSHYLAMLTSPKIKFTNDGKDQCLKDVLVMKEAKKFVPTEIMPMEMIPKYVQSYNGMSGKSKLPTELHKMVLASRVGGMSIVREGFEGLVHFENGAVLLDVVSLYPAAAIGIQFLMRKDVIAEYPDALDFGKKLNKMINKYFDKDSEEPPMIFPVIRNAAEDIIAVSGEDLCNEQKRKKLGIVSNLGMFSLAFIYDPIGEYKRWISVTPGKKGSRLDWQCPIRVSKWFIDQYPEIYAKLLEEAKEKKINRISIEPSIQVDHVTLAMLDYFGCYYQVDFRSDSYHFIFKRASMQNFTGDLIGPCIFNKMLEDKKPEEDRNCALRETYKAISNIVSGKSNENSSKTKIKFTDRPTYEDIVKSGEDYLVINGLHCIREETHNEGIPNIIGELIYSVSKAIMFHYFEAVDWEFYRVETDSILVSARWVKILSDAGYIGKILGQLSVEKIEEKIGDKVESESIIKTVYLLGPKASLFISANKGLKKAVFKGFPKEDLKSAGIENVFDSIITTGKYEHNNMCIFKRKLFDDICGVEKYFGKKTFDYSDKVLVDRQETVIKNKVIRTGGKTRIVIIDDSKGYDKILITK